MSWDKREGKTCSLHLPLKKSLAVNRLCKGVGQGKLFGELICVLIPRVVIPRRDNLSGHQVVLQYNTLD